MAKLSGTDEYEALMAILKDETERMRDRVDAAKLLGKLGDIRAVTPLIQALKNENSQIRVGVAKGLGTLKDTRAVEPLIQALQDENRAVRRAATTALGKLEDARIVAALLQALHDKDWEVKNRATEALEAIGEPAMILAISTLQDESKYVRRAVVRILQVIGDLRSIEALTQALNDEDHEVQVLAQKALEKIKTRNR